MLRERRTEAADAEELVVGVVNQLRRQVDAGDGCLAAPLGGEDGLERRRLDADGVGAIEEGQADAAAREQRADLLIEIALCSLRAHT